MKSASTNKYIITSLQISKRCILSARHLLLTNNKEPKRIFLCYPSRSSVSAKSVPTSLISTFTLDYHKEHELRTSLCSLLFLFHWLVLLYLLEAGSIFGSVTDARSCLDPPGHLLSHFMSLLAALVLAITWFFPHQALHALDLETPEDISDHHFKFLT